MITIPAGAQIAVVDDNELDRMIIARVLKMSELKNPITEFSSGTAFIEYLSQPVEDPGASRLSLVLMDINMPVMSGFETLTHIRTKMGLVDLPIVVMLTSSDAIADIAKAEELGAEAYLAKQSGLDKFVALFNETFTNDEAA